MALDEAILGVMRGLGAMATYVIKNWLRPTYRCTTAEVRRRLKSMEKRGLVERASSTYAVMLCWRTA